MADRQVVRVHLLLCCGRGGRHWAGEVGTTGRTFRAGAERLSRDGSQAVLRQPFAGLALRGDADLGRLDDGVVLSVLRLKPGEPVGHRGQNRVLPCQAGEELRGRLCRDDGMLDLLF